MKNKTVGIIFALSCEMDSFKNFVTIEKTHSIANRDFYECSYLGNRIIFVKSGIGKVNASCYTALLNAFFNPDIVINSGIAGSVSKELGTLETVIVRQSIYSDFDMTSDPDLDIKYGQVQEMPRTYSLSSNIIDQLVKICPNAIIGDIASGDAFIADYDEFTNKIKKYFNDLNIIACDMESCAIMQTCYLSNIPCIVIRTISDIVGGNQAIDYPNLSRKAADISAAIIDKILEYVEI